MYSNRIKAAFVVLALATVVLAQELPTERPAGCDGSKCVGCTPFVPKPGKASDYPCGQVDVYFPVPIYAIRNDTSADKEITSRQWACFACCTLGCGFDDPQNTCAYTKYQYEENGKYGCTSCKGKDTYVEGGTVKLNFEDLSTSSVYSVINQPYGACIPSDMAKPSPSVQSPPPAVATPSPPPPVAKAPATTPPPSPPVEEAPATTPSPPPPVEEAPSPSPEVVEEAKSPESFVPIDIGSTTSTTTGESSSGSLASAHMLMILAMAARVLL